MATYLARTMLYGDQTDHGTLTHSQTMAKKTTARTRAKKKLAPAAKKKRTAWRIPAKRKAAEVKHTLVGVITRKEKALEAVDDLQALLESVGGKMEELNTLFPDLNERLRKVGRQRKAFPTGKQWHEWAKAVGKLSVALQRRRKD